MLDFCLRIIKPCWCLFGGIDGTRVSWFVVCFLLFLFKSLFWNMRDIHLRAAAASFLSHDQTRVLLLDEIFTGCKIKVSSGLSIVCFCLRKLKRLIAVQGRGWMSWWLCHAVVLQDGGIHPRLVEVCLRILSCVILTEPWLPPPPPHPPLTFSHLDSSGFAC